MGATKRDTQIFSRLTPKDWILRSLLAESNRGPSAWISAPRSLSPLFLSGHIGATSQPINSKILNVVPRSEFEKTSGRLRAFGIAFFAEKIDHSRPRPPVM